MDERAAIEKCQKGEPDAFRFLVEAYQAQAVRHAAAILGNRADAQDAAQDAFIDAFRALKTFDKDRKFYPWFYVLLRNRCFKMTAKRRETLAIEDLQILAPQANPSEQIRLESALLALSKEEREIIVLKYLEGFSYEELAAHLEIPRGTVMSRLFHARKHLQRQLEKKI
jgi:RNA polymerase sigma-70 factor (ECF subfamily)